MPSLGSLTPATFKALIDPQLILNKDFAGRDEFSLYIINTGLLENRYLPLYPVYYFYLK